MCDCAPPDVLPDAWRAAGAALFSPYLVFPGASLALIAVRATSVSRINRPLACAMSKALPAGILLVAVVMSGRVSAFPPLADRTNDRLFAAIASEHNGLLLTAGSIQLVQLRTRRPVLLDGGALDMLAYSPSSGPAMEEILRVVYGIDFFTPPEAARGTAIVDDNFDKSVWEGYSRQRWEEIGRRFDVTDVLTERTWTIDLPIAAENSEFKLYRIPR